MDVEETTHVLTLYHVFCGVCNPEATMAFCGADITDEEEADITDNEVMCFVCEYLEDSGAHSDCPEPE